MKPRLSPALRRFALVFSGLFWLVVLVLSLFFAPSACHGGERLLPGMVAAHRAGMTHYLEIERYGRTDAVAVFRCNGSWRWYHPSVGTADTGVSAAEPPPMQVWFWKALGRVSGKWAWRRVPPMTKWACHTILPNGCMVDAVEGVRRSGGIVREGSPGAPGKLHAYRVALR